jgi:hypothetical protein
MSFFDLLNSFVSNLKTEYPIVVACTNGLERRFIERFKVAKAAQGKPALVHQELIMPTGAPHLWSENDLPNPSGLCIITRSLCSRLMGNPGGI